MRYLLEGEETERLRFRKIRGSDFKPWLEFFKDPSSFAHWVEEFEDPETECKKWFARQAERYKNDEGGMNALIEKSSGELIGFCGLLVQVIDGSTALEVAYSLLPAFRNQGYASEGAKKCRDFAFESNYAESLISIISLPNVLSANVARKNGMQILRETVYKKNQVNIYQISKSDWQKIRLK